MSQPTHPKQERTVLIVKPDGVKRGLVGEIIRRIETRGLKIIALKMLAADEKKAHDHYPNTEDWIKGMGLKTLENYEKYGKDPIKEVGTADALAIGNMVAKWNVDYLTSGPMVAILIEGIHAIDMVRKIAGATIPAKADPGSIRGDYSVDSPTLANTDKRAIRNLIHASSDPGEAAHEINHWFAKYEIHDYKRSDEDVMF